MNTLYTPFPPPSVPAAAQPRKRRVLYAWGYGILFSLFLGCGPLMAQSTIITSTESVLGLSDTQAIQQSAFGNENHYFSLSSYETPFPLTGRLTEHSPQTVSFAYSQRSGNSYYHLSLQNVDDDLHASMGASLYGASLSAHYGSSDGMISSRQGISGIAPNFFHGAVSYTYDYSGVSVGYTLSDNWRVHGGAMFIEATGLEDRSVYFGGVDYKNFSASVSSVSRDGESMGYSVTTGITLDTMELSYQEIHSEYDARWRQLTIAHTDEDALGTLQLSLGTGSNDLYAAGEETRLTLSYSIPLGGPKKHSTQTPATYSQRFNGQIAQASQSFQSLGKTGRQAVGAGLLLSSGNARIDSAPRFVYQDQAGYYALYVWNPISVRNNLEYGSAIYQNRDGTFAPSLIVIEGTVDSVGFIPQALVPYGTLATADWHTHGAYDPRYLNEEFSSADIEFSDYYGVDGYLGTPSGRMKLYDVDEQIIYTFVDQTGNEFILPN